MVLTEIGSMQDNPAPLRLVALPEPVPNEKANLALTGLKARKIREAKVRRIGG